MRSWSLVTLLSTSGGGSLGHQEARALAWFPELFEEAFVIYKTAARRMPGRRGETKAGGPPQKRLQGPNTKQDELQCCRRLRYVDSPQAQCAPSPS
jgi:hypothetical protein